MKRLADEIMKYESDTFSASGSEITLEEAEELSQMIITDWIENQLDGITISDALSTLRETKIDHGEIDAPNYGSDEEED
jgi:hypothetical protein